MQRDNMAKVTWKIWLLIIFVAFSLIAIFSLPPQFLEKGVLVKSVEQNSSALEAGIKPGMKIISINNQEISSVEDYQKALEIFSDNQTHKLEIKTDTIEAVNLFQPSFVNEIVVNEIPNTRITTGLDIQGGVRALVTAQDHTLTSGEVDDLIAMTQQRLNVFGLSDLGIQKASDSEGNWYMVVQLAGSSPTDLVELITQQGKFEAKIGNETIFVGGNKDITYVGKSGQDAGIYQCNPYQSGTVCEFRFVIYLSEEAAQKQADVTSSLGTNISTGGRYLDKPLDLYLDDIKIDSLSIGTDLKGKVTTQIQISGSGSGATQQEAISDAQANMKKLQTILITGSLPFKLQIAKIDRISPTLGQEFNQAILVAGLLGMVAVSVIIFARYRKIKISLALLLTSFSELIIILGVAALIKWNLDLPSIAGIIATIGTGLDSQIVILDESRFKTDSLSQRIKRALFIIFTSFATAAVSLLPLTGALGFLGIGAAGAGLLKGFAVTTLIGITAGVFITRPAFADIARQIEE
jgi:preprotein translocase subunit SecD